MGNPYHGLGPVTAKPSLLGTASMKAVIVIPALNEASTIGEVIRSIPRPTAKFSEIVVLVVDDGSTDETITTSRLAGADAIVSHRHNLGVGAAVKTGIEYALRMNPDVICTIDADGQFSTSEIEQVMQPVAGGYADLVIGSRFHSGNSLIGMPIGRRLGNILVALLTSLLLSRRISDAECGFRAISREAAKDLELLGRFTFTHEMILDMSTKGYRIVEVPISVTYRCDRESRAVKNLFLYGIGVLGMFALSMKRLFRKRPPASNAVSIQSDVL